MSNAKPLTWQTRRKNYRTQTGSKVMTPAQTKRDSQKRGKARNS